MTKTSKHNVWQRRTRPNKIRTSSLRHVGLIPDGNRTWARRKGVPLEVAYERAGRCLGNCIRSLFEVRTVKTVSLYLMSTKNMKRDALELNAFLAAGILFGEDILPDILREHKVSLLPLWLDRFNEKLKGIVSSTLAESFLSIFKRLSQQSSAKN